MGGIFCCKKVPDDDNKEILTKPTEYSWNQRKKLDPKDFTIENCSDSCLGRLPGTINGEQFIIQNCKNMRIYLLDNIGTISVDDCTECDIIIGPVKTSVFIRDCIKCNIMVACQQFRTRDCRNLNVFLSCTSQPIIESTSKFKVACYQLYYPQLADQFKAAILSPFNCTWSDIYDFTPVDEQGLNFSFLPEDSKPFDFITPPASVLNMKMIDNHGDSISSESEFVEKLTKMEINDFRTTSVVPYTLGNRRSGLSDGPSHIVSLILLFHNNGEERNLALDLIRHISENSNIQLVKTRESKLSLETAKSLFGPKVTEKDLCLQGPVISLEYLGSTPANAYVSLFKQNRSHEAMDHLIYVSPDMESSKAQIELISNLTNMYMNTF